MLKNSISHRHPLEKPKRIFRFPQNHTYFMNFPQGDKHASAGFQLKLNVSETERN